MASLLPDPEPVDPVEGALGHFEHTNWVKAALKALDVGTVHSQGASIDGNLYVNPMSTNTARIYLQGDSTKDVIGVQQSGSRRWGLILGDATPESGGHAGSLFSLVAYGDDGSERHSVLKAGRNSGLLTVAANPTAPLGIATKDYVDSTVIPVGAIIAFGGSTLPAAMQATWQLCDGTPHNSAALQAVIGSANTPDLRSRFIVGAGQGPGLSNYPVGLGAAAGAESVTLTQAQTPVKSHTHSIDHAHGAGTSGIGTAHSHTMNHDHAQINTGSDAHNHTINLREGTNSGDGYYVDTNPTDSGVNKTLAGTVTSTDTHTHTVNLPTFAGSTGTEAAHTHSTSVAAHAGLSGAASDATATAHENRPPYYALTYIIKKV